MKNRKDIALILTIQSMKMSMPDAAVISLAYRFASFLLYLKTIDVSHASHSAMPVWASLIWSSAVFTAVSPGTL